MTSPALSQFASLGGIPVQRVAPMEYLRDTQSHKVTVTNTSKTLATLIGAALPAGVLAVTLVIGDSAIYYNPAGAATTSNSTLPTVFTVYGTKAQLDLVQLYASTNTDIGVIVHEPGEVLPS